MTKQPQKRTMMYTPVHRIPIGEPVKTPDGNRAVKFKKHGGKETEIIPLDEAVAFG